MKVNFHAPFIFQTSTDYVPHPMHGIVVTLIASDLSMTLNSILKIFNNVELQSYKMSQVGKKNWLND